MTKEASKMNLNESNLNGYQPSHNMFDDGSKMHYGPGTGLPKSPINDLNTLHNSD